MKKLIPFSLFITFLTFISVAQQPIEKSEVRKVVEAAMEQFDVPGIAVAIVKDGEIVLEEGYGVRSLKNNKPMTEHTLFGVASNSKAFTGAALGLLVEEGLLDWDDKVVDYIPEFRLYDSYVTMDFTIRDLLTHRSGLPLGAGDLMIFPDGHDFTTEDIIYNLRYLKQSSPFRSKFDYDNLLYIVAGEVLHRITGLTWAEFVEENIMQPLQMNNSAGNYSRLKDISNIIDAHAPVNGEVVPIERYKSNIMDPAGGIYSSVHDMALWCKMWLNDGTYITNSDTLTLLKQETINEIKTPVTPLPASSNAGFINNFSGYGLGWFLRDVNGHFLMTHTGGLNGMVTQVTMIPDLELAIIVLTNQQNGLAFYSVTNTIMEAYLGLEITDWVSNYKKREARYKEYVDGIVGEVWDEINTQLENNTSEVDVTAYTGTYKDDWFGHVSIEQENDKLRFIAQRSSALKGDVFFYKANTFVVKWDDRSLDADAYMIFELDKDGKAVGLKMQAISPMTDFSYDFHDLNLRRADPQD
jgi:CubicO group peptidase (beta-lactamase class C family)